MKHLVVIITGLFFILIFITNCGTVKNKIREETVKSDADILVHYGKFIYKRELCGNCHTQEIRKASKDLISLDGLGDRLGTSPYWLYEYLLNPQNINPESKKKSYLHLQQTQLKKEVLSQVIGDSVPNKLWIDLIQKAKVITMELDKFGVESSNTEMLALISYLRHIPASKRKKDLDSLEHLKFNKKKEAWDEINLDSSNVVLKIANNKDNAINGKLIFEQKCAACHGTQGGGMIGPNLTDDYWLHGGTKKEIAKTIAHGVTSKGMISWKHTLTPKQIGEVISFITSIKGINPPNAKDPQGIKK